MRVLVLAQFLPPMTGGTERHVWSLSRALAARHHDVTLLGLASGEAPAESVCEGVRVIRVRSMASRLPGLYSDPARPYALPIGDPSVSRAVRRELSRHRYDVIHAHNWIVNSALGVATRRGVPVVMTLHDCSHVCATVGFMEHGESVCTGPSLRRCLSCAASHYGAARGSVTVAANAWYAHRRTTRVSRFAAVSGAIADAVSPENATWPQGVGVITDVVPNFVPDALLLEDNPARAPKGPLVFVGPLSREKGVHTLLDSYQRLSTPPPLLLAGPSAADYVPTIPPGARHLGELPHTDIIDLIRSARAVVVPSVCPDACPTVVLEAMAAGKPVVAAASGGIPELVVDGVTGVLFPPGDVAAMARAISAILEDPRAADALGSAGRERARMFTATAVVERIERMYVQAIEERAMPQAREAGWAR